MCMDLKRVLDFDTIFFFTLQWTLLNLSELHVKLTDRRRQRRNEKNTILCEDIAILDIV